MNMRSACRSPHGRRGGGRIWWWAVLLLIALGGSARAQDYVIPPTLLLPNYDRVYPGLDEALEGGAFIARARNAPALFYNPAGIALSPRTVLNASAQGYQLTTLSGSGFQQTSGGAFEPLPSFVGLVLGKEVIDWETVRIGFAVVNSVHSNLRVAASTTPAEGQRASYWNEPLVLIFSPGLRTSTPSLSQLSASHCTPTTPRMCSAEPLAARVRRVARVVVALVSSPDSSPVLERLV